MEPVGFAFSTVALLSLFKTCVEFFDYFETAQALQSDFELLLVKFDVQKERLLIWGDLVGITKPNADNFPELKARAELIQRCLHSLQNLFINVSQLEKHYGVRVDASLVAANSIQQLSSNRTRLFRAAYERLKGSPSNETRSSLGQKIRWAIHDKVKFEKLVGHVRDLVDNLHNIISIQSLKEDALLLTDASQLDISRLRLMRDACEHDYPTWSDAAVTIITASEASGTLDQRSMGDWAQETTQTTANKRQTLRNPLSTREDLNQDRQLNILWRSDVAIFFVFTHTCFLQGTQKSCSSDNMGYMTFEVKGESFLPGPGTYEFGRWSLGRQITESLDIRFGDDDIEMLKVTNFELGEMRSEVMNQILPLGVLYVFCGPCVCALRTALIVCIKEQSKTVHCWVRVDDRIDTSCCPAQDRLERLKSVMDMIKVIESMPLNDAGHLISLWSQLIDRTWIERRIYALEDEIIDDQPNRSRYDRAAEIFAELEPEKSRKTGFVIIGEVEACQWMMNTSPFPYRPRMPRETEIYSLQGKGQINRWDRSFLGTYTPRDYYRKLDDQTSRSSLSSAQLHSQLARRSSRSPSAPSLPEAGNS